MAIYPRRTYSFTIPVISGAPRSKTREDADKLLNSTWTRVVSKCCSACLSHIGLSTEYATEPCSDDLLNGTRNPSEPYSDKELSQHCPTYQLHFPPKRRKWGPQNLKSGWAGKFREIRGFCRISTEILDPGNSGEFILGTPFLAIWGFFWGK